MLLSEIVLEITPHSCVNVSMKRMLSSQMINGNALALIEERRTERKLYYLLLLDKLPFYFLLYT